MTSGRVAAVERRDSASQRRRLAPSRRLVTLWFGGAVPLLGLAGLAPETGPVVFATLAVFAAVAVADAAAGRRRLATIEASLPSGFRSTRGAEGSLNATVTQSSTAGAPPRRLRLTPAESGRLAFEPETLEISWPRLAIGESAWTAAWKTRGVERGQERLDALHLEIDSPLGWWRLGESRPQDCRVRVDPELGAEGRKVAIHLLRRGTAGNHIARQLGQGREFDRLRDYVPGDSLDQIHWKATARRGRPIAKMFQVERTQEVYVLLDRSRLAGREVPAHPSHSGREVPASPESRVEPALETTLRAALALSIATRRFGDLFGVLAFSDRVERFVRAGSGRRHFDACRDALYDGHARAVAPDFGELVTFLRTRLRRRSLLVLLTDLEDPVHAEAFAAVAGLLASRHHVLAVSLAHEGVEPLFTSAAEDDEAIYDRLVGHRRFQRLATTKKALARIGVDLQLARRAELSVHLVSRYAAAKARQVL